jgi:hypothetical protein
VFVLLLPVNNLIFPHYHYQQVKSLLICSSLSSHTYTYIHIYTNHRIGHTHTYTRTFIYSYLFFLSHHPFTPAVNNLFCVFMDFISFHCSSWCFVSPPLPNTPFLRDGHIFVVVCMTPRNRPSSLSITPSFESLSS